MILDTRDIQYKAVQINIYKDNKSKHQEKVEEEQNSRCLKSGSMR